MCLEELICFVNKNEGIGYNWKKILESWWKSMIHFFFESFFLNSLRYRSLCVLSSREPASLPAALCSLVKSLAWQLERTVGLSASQNSSAHPYVDVLHSISVPLNNEQWLQVNCNLICPLSLLHAHCNLSRWEQEGSGWKVVKGRKENLESKTQEKVLKCWWDDNKRKKRKTDARIERDLATVYFSVGFLLSA